MSNRKQDGAIRLKKDGWPFACAIKYRLQRKDAPSGCVPHKTLYNRFIRRNRWGMFGRIGWKPCFAGTAIITHQGWNANQMGRCLGTVVPSPVRIDGGG